MPPDDLLGQETDAVLIPFLVMRSKNLMFRAAMLQLRQLEEEVDRDLPDLQVRIEQLYGVPAQTDTQRLALRERPPDPEPAPAKRRGRPPKIRHTGDSSTNGSEQHPE